MLGGRDEGMRATGRTLRLEPITISKSASDLSSVMAWWKCSGKPSPKNTISGFMTAMGGEGKSEEVEGSGASSTAGPGPAWPSPGVHRLHTGILRENMSSLGEVII